MSRTPQTRQLTSEEEENVPTYFEDANYSLTDTLYHAQGSYQSLPHPIHSPTGDFPWFFTDTQIEIEYAHFVSAFPGYENLQDQDPYTLVAEYCSKPVCWSFKHSCWIYRNYKRVIFADDASSSRETINKEEETSTDPSESDSEQAEV